MTSELEVMLDMLYEQHKQNMPNDIFLLSWYQAQQFFDARGASGKYGIDPPCGWIPLLMKLVKLGAVKARIMKIEDYETDMEHIDREDPKWSEYVFPYEGNYCVCDVCLNNKDIQRAKHSLVKKYKAELIFIDDYDGDYSRICIRIDDSQDYYFRRLRMEGYPYKVFSYAVQQRKKGGNEPIYREELIKKKRMRKDQEYVSNLFKDLPVIGKALLPFVDIQASSIFIKSFSVLITEEQMEIIQQYAK